MKTRKLLSVLLAVVLVLGTLAAIGLTVSADVTEIATAEDLLKISGQSGEYKLTADITLTGTVESFSGTLDGDGHTVTVSAPMFASLSGTVKNLKLAGEITSDATIQVGALANVVPASLTLDKVTSDVKLTAANASGVGGFIGNVVSSVATTVTIRNCINKGAVSAKANVGGFIGYAQNNASDTTVYTVIDFDYCVNEGDVKMSTTDSGQGAAGFLGYNGKLTDLQVAYCVNKGDISATGGDYGIAGILGCGSWAREYQKATITYSANYGDITITDDENQRGRVAGIVGRWNRRALQLTIDHCYNMGAIHGGAKGDPDGACGILGYTHKNDNNGDTNVITVTNCYNAGTVTAAGGTTYATGVVHNDNAGNTTSSNNYYLTDTAASAGKNIAAAPADKDALNTALKEIGYVVDAAQNDGFAVLAWQCSHSATTVDCIGTKCTICQLQLDENGSGEHDYGDWSPVSGATATTDGEDKRVCGVCNHEETRVVDATGKIAPVDGVYYVENEDQMLWLAYNMNNGTVSASSDIVLKADVTLTNGMTFIDKSYNGTFDGKGHTLSGLNYTIFNALDGTVKNIVLKGDIDYTGISDNNRARKASTIAFEGTAMTVENVVSYVNITSKAKDLNAGGIIGYASGSCTFNRVTYAGNYTMEWTGSGGGLGAIFGWGNAGGSGTTTLTDCSFTGTITVTGDAPDGTLRVGAVAGFGGNGTYNLTRCTNTGTVNYEITDETTLNDIYAGGIIGRLENGFTMTDCVVVGTSTKDNKENYGAFIGYCDTKGNTVKHCVTFITETATFDNGVISNYVGNGEKAHSYVDCYDKLMAEAIGEPITIGGVAYQEYNFGYLNAETKAMKVFKYSQGTITKVDDTNYTIGSYDLSAFVSARLTDVAGYNDLRFIIAADLKGLDGYQSLELSIVFKKGDSEVFTVTRDLATELYAYESAIAAGNTYTAAEGSVLFGMVITDVPTGAWDTVTVSLYDENDRLVTVGQQTSADVSMAERVDYDFFGLENHHAALNYHATWVIYIRKDDIAPGIDNGYKVELVVNGKTYTVKNFHNWHSSGDGSGLRMDMETAGVSFMKGDDLTVVVRIYDENGNFLYYTNPHNLTTGFSTSEYADVKMPENTYVKQTVVSYDDDLNNWGDGATEKLFDGNTTDTKIGGTTTGGKVTVTFSLATATKITYYTLYTGKDTASNTGRNPSGWILYGKVGEEWVVLDDVSTKSGMKPVNSTAYSYKIDNPQAIKDYKIVFATGSNFQMNELELYASPTVELPAEAVKIPVSSFSSDEIENDGGEGLAKLFDGATNTKVCKNVSAKNTFTIAFTLPKAFKLTHYTMITANDTAGSSDRNPKSWKLYGSENGTDGWVLLSDMPVTGLEAKNFEPYTYAIQNPGSYQYYKIEFERKGDLFQMSELQLFTTEMTKQTVTSFSSTNVGNDGDEGLAKLFDDDITGSKVWSGGKDTLTVDFSLENATTLKVYTLTTGGDTATYTSRNPKSWVLYGVVKDGEGNETGTVILAESTGGLQAVNSTTFAFGVDNPQEFKDYRIVFVKDNGFQMNDLSVYA